MGNSPTDMHTHDMLVFFLNHIVGPELAPPVQRGSSLPPLYNIGFSSLSSTKRLKTFSCTKLKHINRDLGKESLP